MDALTHRTVDIRDLELRSATQSDAVESATAYLMNDRRSPSEWVREQSTRRTRSKSSANAQSLNVLEQFATDNLEVL